MTRAILTAMIVFGLFFTSSAQKNLSATFSERFSAYQSIWPQTNLHLSFNQEKFSNGDTVWFKAYFLRENLAGVQGRQLIHFNLVDSRGVSQLHFLFSVTDGTGYNQFIIPASLPSGFYYVTAYSSWMLNFGERLLFRKKIAVVTKNEIAPVSKPEIKIGVEGGLLVGNVPNRIVVLSSLPYANMQIVDSTSREVALLKTNHSGLASLIFTPEENSSYFLRNVNEPTLIALPRAEADGLSLLLTSAPNDDTIKIKVASPPGSRYRDQELVVMLTSQGKNYYASTFRQSSNQFHELTIPRHNLPEGIARISFLSTQGALLANRDIYVTVNDHVRVQLDSLKPRYRTREKVKLEVTLLGDNDLPVAGEFLIRVLNVRLFDSLTHNTLADELNVPVPVKAWNAVGRSASLTTLDHYLVVFSGKYPWEEILSGKVNKPRYNFTNRIQKTGRVYFADTHKPVPDHTQIMFYLQKDRMRYQTFTLGGQVRLTLPDVFGEDEFFYLAETRREKRIENLKIEWENESVTLPHAPSSTETQVIDGYADFVTKKRLVDTSYGFYAATEGANNSAHFVVNNFEDDVVDADVLVDLNDYDLTPTMAELVREVIPSLFYRKIGERGTMRVNVSEPMQATADPVYIIDGVATSNTDYFLSLKPSDVLTIKIIKDSRKLLPLQLLGKNGIVIVETKQGNQREPLDDPSKIIQGISKAKQFAIPNYAIDQDDRRPDFRSTIYWNPSIKTDSQGRASIEFFCSDDIGKLRVSIEGLTTEGRPFSGEYQFKVVQ